MKIHQLAAVFREWCKFLGKYRLSAKNIGNEYVDFKRTGNDAYECMSVFLHNRRMLIFILMNQALIIALFSGRRGNMMLAVCSTGVLRGGGHIGIKFKKNRYPRKPFSFAALKKPPTENGDGILV